MRKIEQQMLAAIRRGVDWKSGNTQVEIVNGVVAVRLHGNTIAVRGRNEDWHYSNCGWETNTTRSRLNALGANIYQRHFTWYRNGKEFVNEDLLHMLYEARYCERYSWDEAA